MRKIDGASGLLHDAPICTPYSGDEGELLQLASCPLKLNVVGSTAFLLLQRPMHATYLPMTHRGPHILDQVSYTPVIDRFKPYLWTNFRGGPKNSAETKTTLDLLGFNPRIIDSLVGDHKAQHLLSTLFVSARSLESVGAELLIHTKPYSKLEHEKASSNTYPLTRIVFNPPKIISWHNNMQFPGNDWWPGPLDISIEPGLSSQSLLAAFRTIFISLGFNPDIVDAASQTASRQLG